MIVYVTKNLTPKEPVPTNKESVSMLTVWDVDPDEWEEYGIDALNEDAEQVESPCIGDTDYEISWYPKDLSDLPEYFAEAFDFYAKAMRNAENIEDDDERMESIWEDTANMPFDPYVNIAVCETLYNCLPDNMDIADLETLADPSNWIENEETIVSTE